MPKNEKSSLKTNIVIMLSLLAICLVFAVLFDFLPIKFSNTARKFDVEVTINLPYSNSVTFNMRSDKTVADAISAAGITLDDNDVVTSPLSNTVLKSPEFSVFCVDYDDSILTEEVEYITEFCETDSIPKGTTKLLTHGQNGIAERTRQTKKVNGTVISDTVINEKYVNPVINEVYGHGVGGKILGKDGKEYDYSYYIDVIATAYEEGGLTAMGDPCYEGVIAVDPKVIPLGTYVYVKGTFGDYGRLKASDTGGVIKGNKIDICMHGPIEKLFDFGVRSMRAYILE
ncbi:MAG: G5 domain-containing protein [Clostridia bacterium]|nr:G5 domain-containing protein [Clostridia bacterium]